MSYWKTIEEFEQFQKYFKNTCLINFIHSLQKSLIDEDWNSIERKKKSILPI